MQLGPGIVLKWLVIALVLYLIGSLVMSIIQPTQLAGRVKLGMSKDGAIKIVGQAPMQEQKEFSACEGKERHWTGNCDALIQSGSKTFLIWKFGVDTVLVVGLDANDKVVFSGAGDT
jgi:hypothetical protein